MFIWWRGVGGRGDRYSGHYYRCDGLHFPLSPRRTSTSSLTPSSTRTMPTAKSTTYRARTHRLRGEAKTPAAKSAKAKKPATKKSKKPELTPRMKEFVKLAKARKEREFFEKLTDDELDTFAKALKMKLPDSRQNKLKVVIAYSKQNKPALIRVNTSVVAASAIGMAAPLLYLLVKKRGEAEVETGASEKGASETGASETGPQNENTKGRLTKDQKQLLKIISALLAGATGMFSVGLSQILNKFKRFQKALRALK